MESNQVHTLLPANNNLVKHMFIKFLRTHTTAQAPHAKSERTPNPELFSQQGFSNEQAHERLESFEITLDLKITLNLNSLLTPEARIAYTFTRTSGTAQKYIASKIQARYY